MSNLSSKLNRFIHLPWRDKRLLLEACLSLGMARLAVLILPFKRLAGTLGTPMLESLRSQPRDGALLQCLAGAIDTAGRHTPWKSNCLARAVAAKWMLRRRGVTSTLYLGLMREPSGEVAAHAWVRCGDMYVTGGCGESFTVVGAFTEIERPAEGAAPPISEIVGALTRLKDQE